PDAAAGVRAAARGCAAGRRYRRRAAGEPAGGLAAFEGAGGGGAGAPRAPRHAAYLRDRSRGARRAQALARPFLGRSARRVPSRDRGRCETAREEAMSATITMAPVRKSIRVK